MLILRKLLNVRMIPRIFKDTHVKVKRLSMSGQSHRLHYKQTDAAVSKMKPAYGYESVSAQSWWRSCINQRLTTAAQQLFKMASSMSGMFSGQQPPGAHPVGGPGGPGQPGFPGPATRAPGGNTLVDELEASFEVGC